MMKRGLALLGLVASLLAGAGPSRAADACQLLKRGELAVRFDRNRPLVEAVINGKPAWFLLDTGASNSVLFADRTPAYGLRLTPFDNVTFMGVGGGRGAKMTVVREFQLAGAKVKDLKLLAIGGGGEADLLGILGRDLLGNWDLEFDLANKLLRLWTPQHCGDASLAYWAADPIIAPLRHQGITGPFEVTIAINGRPFEATLDSGAQTSVITTFAASAVGLRKEALSHSVDKSRGIGEHDVETRTGVFDLIEIGGEKITHARLGVADLFGSNREQMTGSYIAQRLETQDQPGMLLGADFLRAHRVLLSGAQHRFYATYNGGPIFQVVGEAAPATKPAAAAPGGWRCGKPWRMAALAALGAAPSS